MMGRPLDASALSDRTSTKTFALLIADMMWSA
jgi:hypothetical protein